MLVLCLISPLYSVQDPNPWDAAAYIQYGPSHFSYTFLKTLS